MMVSMDFVELNPALDRDDITAKIAMDLLQDFFTNLNVYSEQELKLG
jgi:arginase